MLLHPVFFLFLIFLFLSLFMVFSNTSWFIAWIALEVNMLSFIPIILKKKNKYTSESALKYFLTQSMASLLMIISLSMLNPLNNFWLFMLLSASLAIKMGAAPFHQWMPSLIEGMTWQTIIIFLILQKINPLIMLSFCPLAANSSSVFLLLIIFFSAMIGSVGGLNQSSVRSIMLYSSISHMAWMLSAIYIFSSLWVLYYLIYSLILFSILNIFNNKEIYNLNHLLMKQKTNFFLLVMCLFSLGGLPPFSGFISKLLVSLKLLTENHTFIFLFLLTSTFLSLFFYMRLIITNILLYNSHNYFFFSNKNNNKSDFVNLIIMMTPMIIFIL
uniref:NADH-ubiquinone oxidoreductase chain 2 n=1 Tax=Platorchestia parapacifica TaxID=1395100 RepID=A0A343SA14_9CRUS|nr:NADH dehydrogenase subunit 2 [Platorchestia parapacifica]